MSRTRKLASGFAVCWGLAGCSLSQDDEGLNRHVFTATQAETGRITVCAEPVLVREIGDGSAEEYGQALPPLTLLRDGAFHVCRAYQAGWINEEQYRLALVDQSPTLLRHHAARQLMTLTITAKPMREALLQAVVRSRYLETACLSLALNADDNVMTDTEARAFCVDHLSPNIQEFLSDRI